MPGLELPGLELIVPMRNDPVVSRRDGSATCARPEETKSVLLLHLARRSDHRLTYSTLS
jgi:hypothetical protein